MNEHLASENTALIAELAKLQRKQRQQEEEEGRQRQGPSLVAGIPAHQLESLLSLPGTSPAAAVAVPYSSASAVPLDVSEAHAEAPDADQAQKKSVEKKSRAKREMPPEAWDASHSALQLRAQTLETQVELTRLRAEGEVLRAEAAEALTEAQAKQGVINMLQQQLSAAHSQHDKEVKELKRAAKLMGRRTEELTQQLPKAEGDSSIQVSWMSMPMLRPKRSMSAVEASCAFLRTSALHVDALACMHRCCHRSSSSSLLGCQHQNHTTAIHMRSSTVRAAGQPRSGCSIAAKSGSTATDSRTQMHVMHRCRPFGMTMQSRGMHGRQQNVLFRHSSPACRTSAMTWHASWLSEISSSKPEMSGSAT